MAVDVFDRGRFELALTAAGYQWRALGLVKGEYTYSVRPDPDKPYAVVVRSSIRGDGKSAATGQDSIRAYLTADGGGPVGAKLVRWTTRLPGWGERLATLLRRLADLVALLGPCPNCGRLIRPRTAGAGPHKGKSFLSCGTPRCYFRPLNTPTDGPPCPACQGGMVKRVSNSAANPGREYWSCPAQCRGGFKWADEPMAVAR